MVFGVGKGFIGISPKEGHNFVEPFSTGWTLSVAIFDGQCTSPTAIGVATWVKGNGLGRLYGLCANNTIGYGYGSLTASSLKFCYLSLSFEGLNLLSDQIVRVSRMAN